MESASRIYQGHSAWCTRLAPLVHAAREHQA
jgi:hypothetical protein